MPTTNMTRQEMNARIIQLTHDRDELNAHMETQIEKLKKYNKIDLRTKLHKALEEAHLPTQFVDEVRNHLAADVELKTMTAHQLATAIVTCSEAYAKRNALNLALQQYHTSVAIDDPQPGAVTEITTEAGRAALEDLNDEPADPEIGQLLLDLKATSDKAAKRRIRRQLRNLGYRLSEHKND